MKPFQHFRPLILLIAAIPGCAVAGATAQWVAVDTNYPDLFESRGYLRAVTIDSESRVILGGNFTNFGGLGISNIARIKADGTIDTTFRPIIKEPITELQALPGSRVLVQGQFTRVNGSDRPGLALLLSDGSLDGGFAPAVQGGSPVNGLPGPDGAIWVWGGFTNMNGVPCNRVARFMPNGTLDPGFASPFSGAEGGTVIAVQTDGKAIIAGSFSNAPAGLPATGLLRLHTNGAVDTVFISPLLPNERASRGVLQADGRLVAAVANSSEYINMSPQRLIRLNIDGSLDGAFALPIEGPGFPYNTVFLDLALSSDGSLLVAGNFLRIGGIPRGKISRILSDGSVDPCFELPLSANLSILTVAAAPDGGGFAGGNFAYLAEDRIRANLLRLLPPPACDRPGVIEFSVASVTVDHSELQVTLPLVRHGARDLEQSVGFRNMNGSAYAGVDFQGSGGSAIIARGERSGFVTVPLVPSWGAGETNYFLVQLQSVTGGAVLGSRTNLVVELVRKPFSSAGVADTNYLAKLDGPVNFICSLADGRAVIAGNFTNVNNQFCPNIARLNPDGSRDLRFNRSNVFSSSDTITAVAVDTFGRLLIGGYFQEVDNLYRPGLARLNLDGSLDASFAPFSLWPTNQYYAPSVYSLAILPDGSILCSTEVPDDSYSRAALLKFSAEGELDQTFTNNLAFPTQPRALRALPDGTFLAIASGMGHSLMRFNPDGTLVRDFVAPADRDYSYGMVDVQRLADGRLLMSGFPSAFGGLLTVGPLSRFNADGSLDVSLAAAPQDARGELGSISAMALSADSRTVIAAYTTNGSRMTLRRLNADGSRDYSFDDGTGFKSLSGSSSVYLRSVVEMPQGGWLVGGEFGSYNGFNQKHLVRVLPDGAPQSLVFTLSPTNIVLGETNTVIALEIVRRGGAAVAAAVEVLTIPGTASPGTDFLPIHTNVVFGIGEWMKTVPLVLMNDAEVEPTEAFQVLLTKATTGYSIGGAGVLQVSITNDDSLVEFAAPLISAREEDGFAFGSVRWDGAVQSGMRVRINITPVDGRASDLGVTSLDIEYQRFMATNTFRIPIVENTTRQPLRQFTLSLVPISPNLTSGSLSNATLMLTDADFTTAPARGVAGVVHDLCEAPGRGVYLAGDFTGVHGISRSNLARLQPDGEVDPGFNPGAGVNGAVYRVASLPEDKLLIAGDFTSFGGIPRQNLARLNPDGSLEASFDPGTGPAFVNSNLFPATNSSAIPVIHDLLPRSDGTLYISGTFNTFNGTSRPGLVRLLSNGQVDPGFIPVTAEGPFRPIPVRGASIFLSLAIQNDKLLAAGSTTLGSGLLARYESNGSFDSTFFRTNLAARALAVMPSGNVLLGLSDSSGKVSIRALNTNGGAAPGFSVRGVPPLPSLFTEVRQILVQPDSRILCSAAWFQTNGSGSLAKPGQLFGATILRLLPDGQWDASFPLLHCPVAIPVGAEFWIENPGPYPVVSRNAGSAARMAVQSDGLLVIAGAFEEINGEPRHRLARFDSSGALRGRLHFEFIRSPSQLLLPAEVEQPYMLEYSDDLKTWHPWLINTYPWWPATLSFPTDQRSRFFRGRTWQPD